jgi:tetratricopeptide (TPR) repeat protein
MAQTQCPREAAQRLLTDARHAGDRRRECAALADLGVMHLFDGDAAGAVPLLEDALALARHLGDAPGEGDTLGQLGLAAAAAGQPERGLAFLEEELSAARAAGDRPAEQAALAHLGLTWSRLRQPRRALPLFAAALDLARQTGDWQHEAEFLWYMAIQHAALGERHPAIAHAQAAVRLFEARGKPQGAWFAHHLDAYRRGDAGAGRPDPPGPPAVLAVSPGGVVMDGGWEARQGPAPAADPQLGPRLLDMALSAAQAMARFLGSRWQTTTPEVRAQRLAACAACPRHSGLRCRLCGCFTGVKASMAHEECPLGQWPA